MANIKDLFFKQKPYGCIHTSIGDLCVFCHSAKDMIEIEKDLGKPINRCQPIDFVRKLVQYICFPKSTLKDGKYKPDKPILTNADILSLTDVDLESIAQLYVENSDYLFKKTLWKEKTDNEGKKISYTEYGEIKYPRNEDESYIQYLTRLFLTKEEKQKKITEKAICSLGLNNFSNPLEESIRNSLLLEDSVRKAAEGTRQLQNDLRINLLESKYDAFFTNTKLAMDQLNQVRTAEKLSHFSLSNKIFESMTIKQKIYERINTQVRQIEKAYMQSNTLDYIQRSLLSQIKSEAALKKSFQLQNFWASERDQINNMHNVIESLTNSVKDFSPSMQFIKNSIFIENERFGQERIVQIAEDYIWDVNSNKNVFQQADNMQFWKSISKPIKWIILAIIILYVQAIWQGITNNTILDIDKFEKQTTRIRKTFIKQFTKSQTIEMNSHFVNTKCLYVHISPKRSSRVVTTLSWPCKVKVLAYKNKKRWVKIEWADITGETHQGWTLGRYIY